MNEKKREIYVKFKVNPFEQNPLFVLEGTPEETQIYQNFDVN